MDEPPTILVGEISRPPRIFACRSRRGSVSSCVQRHKPPSHAANCGVADALLLDATCYWPKEKVVCLGYGPKGVL
ncbi:hypothetical protein P154DRAFT_521421 [Amniculicola lignicola CBS 123094]|uniref:Uncharacterized protein n=1 Tax=Amniculicola lignicola CBS 123094 TaxID=1392246 RepID=A0A6A5WM81_9PLEO|nr:hypothetical protein P154DRAFT_521421 [Amniculicola lignicola CBS 123094]